MTTVQTNPAQIDPFAPCNETVGILATLRIWIRRSRTRRQLRNIEPLALQDIGIDSIQAANEAAKPFWKA